ncbi:protein PHTF2 isoform X2 [Cydia pomonella]|uniref:protein PHTF2 isoform X2 n=1 Tax=Cydia pomonella TaxID=82600 RepID=UPI002ADE0436|nr:protein PHTF2 isoform X2 [Cydia pomonella]
MMQLAAWYQKKISSYDKEEWETMVEQLLMRGTYRRRIVDFSSHSRSYLIDVDLVRGSSFPKAKPTLSMRRVVWFALARLLFLPALYAWWAQQTSPSCARVLLALWTVQLANIVLYFTAPTDSVDPNCWMVPAGLMVVLSIVHSQIVSTTEMELARVRPRATYRRKLPRYFRRARSECDGGSAGGSGESGATSTHSKPSAKPPKYRRRQCRPDVSSTVLRQRKNKELTKENLIKNMEPIVKKAMKAKDSDDEDYMAWSKPDVSTPIVTFTPPPDEVAQPSFSYKNVLTKKRLESFNVQGHMNLARAMFAEGDDGFESLNGYYSNGSDDRPKEKLVNEQKPVIEPSIKPVPNLLRNLERLKKEDDEKSEKSLESDGSVPAPEGKRVGVRFKKSWAAETIPRESSDEEYTIKKKNKAIDGINFQPKNPGEESSYGSQSEGAHSDVGFHCADSSWDPFALLDPTSDTVKCTMWERGSTLRAELSAVDISWYVVARAERAMAAAGCAWAGLLMAASVALVAPAARLIQVAIEQDTRSEEELQSLSLLTYIPSLICNYSQGSLISIFNGAFGDNIWEITTNMISCALRFALSGLVFFLLAVAERAFKQRFLYAKLFSHLTSARRARKSELPHFRLNTVRNIKTWLSTRSYLRRRGPQRSVDVIVSAAFMLTIILLACVSAHLLRDSITLESSWLLEALVWSSCLGIYLLRLLTLGSNVNRKYRGCLSAILTEQINLHLAIEQRPESKEQLTVANNVLKLAADLLKELDSPFKISGICANHYLYTITKVVILSALSGVLSEMLGFKLKLHKIKIK